ncbi:hypothetical protein BDK51DRAFT_42923 [Blyttiomyces helicus]|uniref:Uncharacterized protein n=1 Tax=Blyttiomyces helicus TaxID=388810 RepID=A0A4P9WTH9_9FUNG|nr:hypothetical protein BDK51DRAFT_42923 [Blyttiomyces helicus]|eukprot:RKO94366.1 hypothetical protein BDK51DRAFT_42923 [Blyttiomyces helicus]
MTMLNLGRLIKYSYYTRPLTINGFLHTRESMYALANFTAFTKSPICMQEPASSTKATKKRGIGGRGEATGPRIPQEITEIDTKMRPLDATDTSILGLGYNLANSLKFRYHVWLLMELACRVVCCSALAQLGINSFSHEQLRRELPSGKGGHFTRQRRILGLRNWLRPGWFRHEVLPGAAYDHGALPLPGIHSALFALGMACTFALLLGITAADQASKGLDWVREEHLEVELPKNLAVDGFPRCALVLMAGMMEASSVKQHGPDHQFALDMKMLVRPDDLWGVYAKCLRKSKHCCDGISHNKVTAGRGYWDQGS